MAHISDLSDAELAAHLLKQIYPPHGPAINSKRMPACPDNYVVVRMRDGEKYFFHPRLLDRLATLNELSRFAGN